RRCRRSSVMTTQLRRVVGRSCRAYPGDAMHRFLLSCAVLVVLAIPAAAARASGHVKPGYVVVRSAGSAGGVSGKPVAVIVMTRGGFVLGHALLEAKVEVYHLGAASQVTTQVNGDVSPGPAHWNGLNGKKYIGSNFRFRITGGLYRVVVRG